MLGYCGLGTAVKVSTILFDDKNLELLRGSPWPTPEIQKCSLDFPEDEQTTHKKLHRYFNGKLGGIYVAPKCTLEVAYALKDLQE